MGRLFIILVAVAAFIIWRRWRKLNTSEQRREFAFKGLVFGLILFIIALAVFGRIDMLGAIFASLLLCFKYIIAFAIRNFPFIARIYGVTGGFGLGKKRQLKTDWLALEIDFSSGQISGKILQGQFAGKKLEDLTEANINALLIECNADAKSTYVLRAYLNQRFGTSHTNNSQTSSAMSTEEALEILGLEGQPTEKGIKTAHKQLMQKIHPDRGGNDFLASLVNRARDRLIDGK